MLRRRLTVGGLISLVWLVLPIAGPAHAEPNASCIGHVAGTFAPEFTREWGEIVSFEAQTGVLVPEVLFLAHTDECPI